jgi:hypothetical protein
MLRHFPILLAAVWTALVAPGPAFAAEPVFPKGSSIGLTPPGDLKLSTRFPGFEDPERKVTVAILQLPLSAYEGIERSIFAKNQTGLTDVKRQSFPFQSGIGFLISGHGQDNGVGVHKWFLAATGVGPQFGDLAMLIKVDVPDAASAVYSHAAIRKALESVTFRAPPVDEQLGLLPFKLKDFAGFRVLRVVANDGAILIDGPSQDMIKNPYVIVSVGRGGPENADDRARFARELLNSAPLRDLAVNYAEAIRIDGQPGYEVRATAIGYDGKPLALVQWLRFTGGGFVRVIGAVHKENWDQLFPRFRAVRDGVDLGNGG